MTELYAPFPWFGGKRRVAPVVWQHFGDVTRYIEPFCGGAAVGLAAPHPPDKEIYNDANGLLINAWRAIKYDPVGVLAAATRPISEIEMQAVHWQIRVDEPALVARLKDDQTFYDNVMAGKWLWGVSLSIGNNWLLDRLPNTKPRSASYAGINSMRMQGSAEAQLELLAKRLEKTILLCGDWKRTVTDAILFTHATPTNVTSVFLDPPYAALSRDGQVYGQHDSYDVAHEVRDWCVQHGDDPRLRIALCGYREHEILADSGWTPNRWQAHGGYANMSNGPGQANKNNETIWFSPYCVTKPDIEQMKLF